MSYRNAPLSDSAAPHEPSNLPSYLSSALALLAISVFVLRDYFFDEQIVNNSGRFYDARMSSYPYVFAFAAAAYFLRRWHRRSIQEYLNELADFLLETPTLAPYWLYLRPFSVDGATPQSLQGIFSFNNRRLDFEELLRLAVQRRRGLSLVALGARKTLLGAGRAEIADSAWQEYFQKLAGFAGWIIVIPGGGSVRWEVDFIVKHGILERTIFLMPPVGLEKLELKPTAKSELERAREHWNEAVQEMSHLGLRMPDYRKRGMFFTLDCRGNPERQAILKSNNPRVLRKALRWMTEDPRV